MEMALYTCYGVSTRGEEPIGSAIGTGSVRCKIRFRSIRDRIGIGYDLLGFDWALLGS
jgi:hypothetical protein